MTHKVVRPIALDESFRTTEQNPQNIADVLANKLDAIKSAIENGGSGEMEAAFECHYNVTSATDIYNAMQEKKVPFFYQNGVVAQLWKVETNKYTFRTTSTRVVEGENILDIVDYIVNGSVWSTATKTISGGSSSQQAYLAKVESSVNFDTTGLSGMQSIISVNDVPADGVYQLSIFMCITPKTASATKSDLVFQFTGTSGTGMPNTTFHAVVDDSQTFGQQLSFSTTLNLKAGTNSLKMACGGLNTEYLVFVDDLTVAQLVNGVYHNGDTFEEVNDLTEAIDFNVDDELLVVSPNSKRKMLWTTLANKVLGFIKSLSTTITSFRTGDVIPVDGPSGTAKMPKDDLLKETAENALAGNVAPVFDATASYTPGQEVIYNGKLYRFKLAKSAGSWDSTKVESASLPDIYLTRSKAHKMMQSPMVRITAESRLTGVFITGAGAYGSNPNYEVAIFKVTAGDVLFVDIPLQNEALAALGFYSTQPSSTSDLPVSVIPCSRFDIGNYDIIVESDGFVGMNANHSTNYGVEYSLYKRNQTLVELTAIKSALRKIEDVSSKIKGYFITYQGKYQGNNSYEIRVYEVEANAIYYLENPHSNKSVATFGFSKNAPFASDGSVSVWTQKDAQYFIPSENGYLLVSCPKTSTCYLCRAMYDKTDLAAYSNGQIANLAGEINGYYFSSSRTWQSSSIWKCIYTQVNKGDKLGIDFIAPSGICNFAFFTSEPSNGSTPSDYSIDGRLYIAPASGYVLTSYRRDYYDWHLRLMSSTESVADIFVGRFGQSRLLCIGDSISTSNNYKWKGYLETYKGIKYARDITGEPAPANGGIKVTPAANDGSLPLENRSIWWRCCNKRLAAYENNFDYILFCGGTNDWAQEIPVGTINDPPYVDDASTVESADAVDVRPDTLTYASALKGCIEMLRRDFPTKGIFIRTLYQMSYSTRDPAQIKNYSTIIVKVALKYGLKLIWSQDMWSDSEVDLFTLDGVHPNDIGAYKLANEIAKSMFV